VIKNPLKMSSSLQLLVECIMNDAIELIGNKYIVDEMQKYQELFESPSASILLTLLIFKTKIVEIDDASILNCKPYFPVDEIIDILHAATALKKMLSSSRMTSTLTLSKHIM
jgi:hypothetical protein